MRRISYLKRAAKRFLDGTRMKTPVEAVEAGVCSLQDWVRVLAEEREIEQQYQLEHHARRTKSPLRAHNHKARSDNALFKTTKANVHQAQTTLEA
jgi:hypothetical protein